MLAKTAGGHTAPLGLAVPGRVSGVWGKLGADCSKGGAGGV